MNEGREQRQVSVHRSILGEVRMPEDVFVAHDGQGNVIFTTDVVELRLFVGSRYEH